MRSAFWSRHGTGRVRDPFGHHWIIATRLRDVPEDEMLAAFNRMFGHD